MFDQSLLLLLDEVRGKTLRLLQDVTGKDARWFPPGLHNHILWHAGHSYVLVESLAMEATGQQPDIPEGWFEMFSWKSDPARVAPDRWPPLRAGSTQSRRIPIPPCEPGNSSRRCVMPRQFQCV